MIHNRRNCADGRPHYPYRRWSDRLPELTGGGYDECQKQKMYSKAQLKISLCEQSPQSDRYFCHCADNALLFTSMFTIVLSLNASYETYQFRQVGGYAHGTFKDVSPSRPERIAAHPKVKAAGVRKVIGITAGGGLLPKYRQRSATWMPTGT